MADGEQPRQPRADNTDEQDAENGVAGANGDYKPLTRDAYNLNKMIVVVTASGKVRQSARRRPCLVCVAAMEDFVV